MNKLVTTPLTDKPGPTFKAGRWEDAQQAGFYTRTQLNKQGLTVKRNEQPAAFINTMKGGAYDLFRVEQAQPKRQLSERQQEVLRKGRARYNCPRCYDSFQKKDLFESPYQKGKFCRRCCQRLEEEAEEKEWLAEQRQAAIAEAQTLVTQGNLVFLDTETTGLDPRTARIVEIAIIGQAGNILLNSLVNPGRTIPDEAVRVHGITNATVQDAPTFAILLPNVMKLLTGKTVCIYNVAYDRPILKTHGLDVDALAWACVMKLYAQYHGDYSEYWQDVCWKSLSVAMCQCGLSFADAHRALSDCQAARNILYAVAAKGGERL